MGPKQQSIKWLPPWSSESTAALEQNVSNFNVSFAHFCPLWCKLIILYIGEGKSMDDHVKTPGMDISGIVFS